MSIINRNFIIFVGVILSIFSIRGTEESKGRLYKLLDDTVPLKYFVKLVPDTEKWRNFYGEVFVHILIKKSNSFLLLHSKNLKINYVRIHNVPDDGQVQNASFSTSTGSSENLQIFAQNELIENREYRLNISFNGTINKSLFGLHKIFYNQQNKTRVILATRLEPTYARMVFPCYDEPQFRTPFKLSIARHENFKVISNMPIENTSSPDSSTDNKVWDTFFQTPPMPTYSLGFMVTELDAARIPGENINFWSTDSSNKSNLMVLNECKKVVTLLESSIGIPYPLPKLEIVALPKCLTGGFASWGIVWLREDYLLSREENLAEENKEAFYSLSFHQFVHQWFGHYVSPFWWDYLWMKESFATYFQYFITAQRKPKWRMKDYFLVDVTHYSLFIDGRYDHVTTTAHVDSPGEISSLYTVPAFHRGASILRMLSHIMTVEVFDRAWQKFIIDGYEKGGTVHPADFYTSLEHYIKEEKIVLPKSINDIMKEWTENIGYPLVKVTRKNSSVWHIEQETYSCHMKYKEMKNQLWTIPITYTKQTELNFEKTEPAIWSVPGEDIKIQDELAKDEWIIVNIQQMGYFRVLYDEENWQLLISQLISQPAVINVLNRAQLLDDSLTLARDRKLSYLIAFNLSSYLSKESDMIPWFTVMKKWMDLIRQYNNKYINPTLVPLMKKYMSTCLQYQCNRIGFQVRPEDDHVTRKGRPVLLAMACILGSKECIRKANSVYYDHENDLKRIHPDLRYPVLCTAIRTLSKNTDVRSKLKIWYENADDLNEKGVLLAALACDDNEMEQLKYILRKSFYDDADPRIYLKHFSKHFTLSMSWMKSKIAILKTVKDIVLREKQFDVEKLLAIIKSFTYSSAQELQEIQEILKIAEPKKIVLKKVINELEAIYNTLSTSLTNDIQLDTVSEILEALQNNSCSKTAPVITITTSSPNHRNAAPITISYSINFFSILGLYKILTRLLIF